MLYLCINKKDKAMTPQYLIRPVVDFNDIAECYEFVRISDDAILFSLSDYESIYNYAFGYCDAKNTTFIIL